jgi:hypothetical protein
LESQFRYRAFVSYSHANEDWAKCLHRSLETYRVPKHLVGREHRIFCLIVDGKPGASAIESTADQECFPNALIYTMGTDGQLTDVRSELIAADAL